ncbi:MAG: LysE family translocator [Rhodobacteraceae bacterium]|nr:LysE family translocator [Paracoccaceae bacterium]
MEPATLLALVAACVALAAIPGPNVALIVGNTLAHGARHGLTTVAGTTMGIACQVMLVALGLAVLVELFSEAFQWLRWAGVVWLIWLGIAAWRRGRAELATLAPPRRAPVALFVQGALMACVNPKTLLFNAAFLPQFADPARPSSLLAVAAVYLLTIASVDVVWVLAAGKARGWLARAVALRHRLTGSLYLTAAAGLAMARLPR